MERTTLIFLSLLITADLFYMGFHTAYLTGYVENKHFLITKDRGYAELYQYIKYLWIIGLTLGCYMTNRNFIFLILAVLFVGILIDDATGIHEQFGTMLAYNSSKHYGELAFFLAFGSLGLLISFILLKLKQVNVSDTVLKIQIFLLALLIIFGAVIDFIGGFFLTGSGIANVLGIIEDGGEMLMTSTIVAYNFYLISTLKPLIKNSDYKDQPCCAPYNALK